jgi:hypothetical protein
MIKSAVKPASVLIGSFLSFKVSHIHNLLLMFAIDFASTNNDIDMGCYARGKTELSAYTELS